MPLIYDDYAYFNFGVCEFLEHLGMGVATLYVVLVFRNFFTLCLSAC